ncbi:helix-turn-helix domain-containing protein [Dyadobacter sp. CY312]|uniref:AraC family transcriptional regulator n=1 Tax=Dyadobacter sp. CY312 TaxID=2907303 RepID=UPI001F33740D|nr:helix-turn-helix domain-containing protein [Dyadobacter sp. CY312]MCE7044429.1 helix-turn-helix domain-containing protein [Dyadobacter sp. CY312]
MNYQQIHPAEPLRKYVRYFWTLGDNDINFSHKTFKIVSDGLPGLIFQENPKSFFDENDKLLPQVFLYGQTTKHTNHAAKDHFRNIGIYFQPTALKSVFGIDANELTNKHVDISELFKNDLADQLSNSRTTCERIELLSSFLMQQANQKKIENRKVNFAAAQLLRGVSLRHVQNELDISERSLERYFRQYVGIPPKMYTRINRFQSALESLRQTPSDKLTDIAYQNNYFDQSHFIRDFNEFAGTSPKHFRLRANEQVANFPEWKI